MIVFENIFKAYGKTRALDNFSHSFRGGSTTSIIGPSGCGKSTILRAIVGLITPDAGSITVRGLQLNSETVSEIRRLSGYVIQEGGLFPHLTCYRNVSILAEQLTWTNKRIDSRIAELADVVQLDSRHLSGYPAELSGGQRQRVSIMRALMHDPEIILLDEPLGALDSIVRADLQKDLKAIFQRLNKTVVLITHDLAEASYFSDELILMNEGSIVQVGSLKDLAANRDDVFVNEFIRAQEQSASKFIEAIA